LIAAPSPVVRDKESSPNPADPELEKVGSIISSSATGCELVLYGELVNEDSIINKLISKEQYHDYVDSKRTRIPQVDTRKLGDWLVNMFREPPDELRKRGGEMVIAADKDTIADKALQYALDDATPQQEGLYGRIAWVEGVENADIGQKTFKELQELCLPVYERMKPKRIENPMVCGAITWQPQSHWLARSDNNMAVSIRLAPDPRNAHHPRHFVYTLVVDKRRFDHPHFPIRRKDVAALMRYVEAATITYLDDIQVETIQEAKHNKKREAVEFLKSYFRYSSFDAVLDALLKHEFEINVSPSYHAAGYRLIPS